MGVLSNEYRSFEREVVGQGCTDKEREAVRITFFAGAAATTSLIAQALMQDPETLHVLLKHLACDIADEGTRAGFDWECVANVPAPPMPDNARVLSHFVDLSRLPLDRKAELFDMIQTYVRRYSELPSAVN
ncbi:hypothetical protein ACGYQ5_14440 [Burkholderia pseudomallei]